MNDFSELSSMFGLYESPIVEGRGNIKHNNIFPYLSLTLTPRACVYMCVNALGLFRFVSFM